jgi:hypothetical protein
MDAAKVRVESDFPKPMARLMYVVQRLFVLVILITVLIPLLTEPRIWSPLIWSATRARHPVLGWILEIGGRVSLVLAVCFGSSLSLYTLWFYLLGWKRNARWFQLSPEGLEIGYTRGPQEQIPLAEIECVHGQTVPQGTLATVVVTTRTGKRTTLSTVTGGPGAVDKFCAECGRVGLTVKRETPSLWRVLGPFLAAGPVFVLLVVAVRYMLKW